MTGNPHGYDTRIIPCSRIQLDNNFIEWTEIQIDLPEQKKKRYPYDGVVYKTDYLSGHHKVFPFFIREITLSR